MGLNGPSEIVQGLNGVVRQKTEPSDKPFSEQTPEERVDILKTRLENGELITAAVFDHFHPEEDPLGGKLFIEMTDAEKNYFYERQEFKTDIEGDGILDQVMHGGLVASHYKETGVKVIPVNLNATRNGLNPSPETHPLLEGFQKIVSGETEKPDIVHFSLGAQDQGKLLPSFEELSELTGIKGITADNVAEQREEILDALEGVFAQEMSKLKTTENLLFSEKPDNFWFLYRTVIMRRMVDYFNEEEITPVFSGGNDGEDRLNLYTLNSGTVVVGALDQNGKKAEFSADNALVTHWRQGVFMPTVTKDGVDVTEDGKPDFPLSVLGNSPQENLSKNPFIGRKLSDVRGKVTPEMKKTAEKLRSQNGGSISGPDWKGFIEQFMEPDKVYSSQDIITLIGRYAPPDAGKPLTYFVLKQRSGNNFDELYKNKQGELALYRKPISGTSFAAPSIFRDE